MLSRLRQLFRRRQPAVIVVPQALHVELTSRDRLEIGDWLKLPTTAKVLALLEARHPGTHIPAGLTVAKDDRDERAAVNYLNRIRGWETYRNQLLSLATPAQSRADVVETYPNQ
jgi:hypothetical protein